MDFHVKVGIVDECCQEGDGEDLYNGTRNPLRVLLPSSDSHVELDEHGAVESLVALLVDAFSRIEGVLTPNTPRNI